MSKIRVHMNKKEALFKGLLLRAILFSTDRLDHRRIRYHR